MDNYFKHFPLVAYGNSVSNTVSVNIFAKVAFQKSIQERYEVFHPYTIQEGDRADTIAYLYYGDAGYDWLVYYSNNILDPYYDWYMDHTTFRKYITEKYGSLTDPQRKIKFYRSNYLDDDSLIEPAAYNALTENQKRYWNPLINRNNVPYKYERKQEEILHNTNKVIHLTITPNSNTVFIDGEYVYIQTSGGAVQATATLNLSNTSSATISSITGVVNTSLVLYGADSGATANIVSTNTIATSISAELQSYYTGVSFYDYESELNEKKKNIKLIDVAYLQAIEDEFKSLLSS
jgi:hypothetical protein